MKSAAYTFIVVAAIAGNSSGTFAQVAPDEVLVESATVRLTRADYEAELQRLPPANRAGFGSDPKRVISLLNNMLVGKTMAAEARKEGLDRDPLVQRRMALEADKVLVEAEVQRIEARAGAEFDAKVERYLPKARERYLVDKDKFVVPEEIEASHILFRTDARSEAAALVLAQQAEKKLMAGAEFAAIARESSEDQATKSGGGRLGWFAAKQMDPEFAKAAFALNNVGNISQPVLSRYGYHVIRLEGRRPQRQKTFDEVKDQLVADLRQSYISEQRALRIAAIRNDAALKINQLAIDSLIVQPPDSATLQRLLREEGK